MTVSKKGLVKNRSIMMFYYDCPSMLEPRQSSHIVWKVSSAPQQPKEDPCLVSEDCHPWHSMLYVPNKTPVLVWNLLDEEQKCLLVLESLLKAENRL
jgi:hypothetical protein